MSDHKHELTYAPYGRTGLITVFCRHCREVVARAANPGEARAMTLSPSPNQTQG